MAGIFGSNVLPKVGAASQGFLDTLRQTFDAFHRGAQPQQPPAPAPFYRGVQVGQETTADLQRNNPMAQTGYRNDAGESIIVDRSIQQPAAADPSQMRDPQEIADHFVRQAMQGGNIGTIAVGAEDPRTVDLEDDSTFEGEPQSARQIAASSRKRKDDAFSRSISQLERQSIASEAGKNRGKKIEGKNALMGLTPEQKADVDILRAALPAWYEFHTERQKTSVDPLPEPGIENFLKAVVNARRGGSAAATGGETEALGAQAKAALAQQFPGDTPEALQGKLAQVGRAMKEARAKNPALTKEAAMQQALRDVTALYQQSTAQQPQQQGSPYISSMFK